jgi:hypothetical protein
MERRNVSGAGVTLAPSTVGAAVGAREVGCDAWPAPGGPILTRLPRPSTNRPARVAQSSEEGVDEADAVRASGAPRFTRFAAAVQANSGLHDQLFPRPQRRIRPAKPFRTAPRIQWLGVGSWALFCAALFVSLLLRPDRVSFELDQLHPRALVSDVRSMADSILTTRGLLPSHSQEVASTAPATAPDLEARAADQEARAGLEADLQ